MYHRKVFSTVLDRLRESRFAIQVILGPRQVGKSTGAKFITDQLALISKIEVLSGSADEPDLKDGFWLEQQWKLIRQKHKNLKTPCLLIIDEIQKIENWSEKVKRFWDEDTLSGLDIRILLLGSSALLIRDGLSDSLAGRFEVNHVTHWLYPEMKEAFQFTVDDWIFFGGYPGAARLKNDFVRWSAFIRDSLIETTLSKDILFMKKIEKPALLRRLFELGAKSSSQILSYQKMLGQLQEAGNASTLSHYLELLSQAGLMSGIQKFSGNEVREKASSPKLQICNPALAQAMGIFNLEQLKLDTELWGRTVESAIGAHLINAIAGKNIQLFYWRDRSFEVDFILQKGSYWVGIEVKSGARRENYLGLREFSKRFQPRHVWVVGDAAGIPLSDFCSVPIEQWIDA